MTFPSAAIAALSLLAVIGCQEGQYRYTYEIALRRPDGSALSDTRAAVSVRGSVPKRFNARRKFGEQEAVRSDSTGTIRGIASGWFAAPLLIPYRPQACKLDRLWIYVEDPRDPRDPRNPRDPRGAGDARVGWREVSVAVHESNVNRDTSGEYGPCSGAIAGIEVVVPDAPQEDR